ncbi:NUDIX domain-containing protein [Litorimonas taeanensis]|uniref:NUDIX domain-containing protein n=1 Tax=Litorimonas taeanensis TaxID=568099 RepID=A0A420WLG2_9PROT|nr:NUDIX hydrolase [Litorimonas taeanensis]RKQ71752.1 NUDIX domain-containing protein [Litorimonas taeanensis]
MKRDSEQNFPLGKIKMTEQEVDRRAQLSRAPRPRIASTIVLTIGDKTNPKILMGQRSKRHDFMPSVYVFPGGRVDRADSYAKYAGDLSPRTERILEAAYTPRKSRAIVLAAVRETWEETRLLLGKSVNEGVRNLNHPSYDAFRKAGLHPDISGIEVFGRAITPPHRHKRFDAWFFHKHLGDIQPPKIEDSAELLNVGWFTFDDIENLERQRATTMMLGVLKDYLSHNRPPKDIFQSKAIRGEMRASRFPEIN